MSDFVCQRGFATPALFFLEMYRPLTNVMQGMMIVSMPLVCAFFGVKKYNEYLELLSDKRNVDLLIELITVKEKTIKESGKII